MKTNILLAPFILANALLGSGVVAAPTPRSDNTLVDLGYAKYRGVSNGNGVTKFLGLRYAAAPLGNLRFAAPQGAPGFSGTHDANGS